MPLRAFTLLDVVIYISLFSILLTGAFGGFLAIQASAHRNQAQSLLLLEGEFILSKIEMLLREARIISKPLYEDESDELRILTKTSEETSLLFGDDVLFIQRGGEGPVRLSSNLIKITDLHFMHLGGGGMDTPEHISYRFSLVVTDGEGKTHAKVFHKDVYLAP